MSEHDIERRTILASTATLLAGVAGCAGAGSGGTDGGPTGTATATAVTPTPELDLREANVMAVAFERSDGSYRFDVTLYHDDDGEEGYANWWQVETLAGERLGRRDLLHAHGTREFTRSGTIEIPDGVACVVVRGHDETHGYGGRAMLVTLETGAATPVDQGPQRGSFDAADCP